MKNLRTLLEASILDNVISEASLLDIEGTLNMDIDINLLFSAKSQDQFDQYAKTLKTIIENSAKGPVNYKQLKKGKAYIYIWKDSWSDDDSYAISFVDKYPIQDKNTDYIDDAFYTIYWISNRQFTGVTCNYDDTGNSFTDLLQQDFGNDTMKGAYEIPNEYLKDIKNIMKNASRW